LSAFTLADLAGIIAERAGSSAEKSYTKSLLEAGPPRAAKKFGEEAVEAVIAAIEGDRIALRNEAADVLYHLLVLLRAGGVELDEVLAELQRRTSRSGHEEKASRPGSSGSPA
jgi:phosphoribosyl-ATP pyrophosphohydrolase